MRTTKKMPLAIASVGALDLADSCWLLLLFSLVGNTLQEVVSSFRRQLLDETISQVVVCVHLANCQVSKSVGVTLENTGRMDCGSLCDTIQSMIR
jgi:hypothetical protein